MRSKSECLHVCSIVAVRGSASPPPPRLPSPINHRVLSNLLIITAPARPSSLLLCHYRPAQASPLSHPDDATDSLRLSRVPSFYILPPRISHAPCCGHDGDLCKTQLRSCYVTQPPPPPTPATPRRGTSTLFSGQSASSSTCSRPLLTDWAYLLPLHSAPQTTKSFQERSGSLLPLCFAHNVS